RICKCKCKVDIYAGYNVAYFAACPNEWAAPCLYAVSETSRRRSTSNYPRRRRRCGFTADLFRVFAGAGVADFYRVRWAQCARQGGGTRARRDRAGFGDASRRRLDRTEASARIEL